MPEIWNSREVRVNGWTAAGAVLIIALVFMSIVWTLVFFSFGIRVATAGIVGRGEARIQIQSADFRIQAYQQFFDLCASIQAAEDRMDETHRQIGLLDAESDPWFRKQEEFAAQSATRQRGIRDYNTDANRSWTQGQFRDEDLAFQLTTELYDPEGGNKTICVLG